MLTLREGQTHFPISNATQDETNNREKLGNFHSMFTFPHSFFF